MRLTVEKIMALDLGDNWVRERPVVLFGDRRWVSHRTALRDERVDIHDRIWLGIQLLGDAGRRLFACRCADRALLREQAAGREPDERSWSAVEVGRRCANGQATVEELDAAKDAACAAIISRDAAWADAWRRAVYAASAAWAAARGDAWDAAWATVSAGDWAVEHRAQIEDLIQLIEEETT